MFQRSVRPQGSLSCCTGNRDSTSHIARPVALILAHTYWPFAGGPSSLHPIPPSGRSDCTDPRMSCRFRSHGPTEPTRLFLPSILGTSLDQSEFARSIFETLSPQSKPGTLVIYESHALPSQFPLARQYHGILSRLSCRDALSKTTRWHPLSCY